MLQDGSIAKTAILKNGFPLNHEWTIISCEFVPRTLAYLKLNISDSWHEDCANRGYRT